MAEQNYDIDEVFAFLTDRTNLYSRVKEYTLRLGKEKPDSYCVWRFKDRLFTAYTVYCCLLEQEENLGTNIETVSSGLNSVFDEIERFERIEIGGTYQQILSAIEKIDSTDITQLMFAKKDKKGKNYSKIESYRYAMFFLNNVGKKIQKLGIIHPLDEKFSEVTDKLEERVKQNNFAKAIVAQKIRDVKKGRIRDRFLMHPEMKTSVNNPYVKDVLES